MFTIKGELFMPKHGIIIAEKATLFMRCLFIMASLLKRSLSYEVLEDLNVEKNKRDVVTGGHYLTQNEKWQLS